MATSHARKSPTFGGADDLIGAFAKQSPTASRTRLTRLSRAAALLTALTDDQLQAFAAAKAALPDLVNRILAQTRTETKPPERISLQGVGPVVEMEGDDPGDLLSEEEGLRRLYAYAKPSPLEDWAGPTAGPVDIERTLEIPRSTLHHWQRKGLIIGLLNGVRKNVFPLDQFVDGKPLAGLAEVLTIIDHPRVTWRWMRTPHPLLGGAKPLTRLKQGRVEEVLRAAQTNFGQ